MESVLVSVVTRILSLYFRYFAPDHLLDCSACTACVYFGVLHRLVMNDVLLSIGLYFNVSVRHTILRLLQRIDDVSSRPAIYIIPILEASFTLTDRKLQLS